MLQTLNTSSPVFGICYCLNFQKFFLEAAATGEGGRGEGGESEERAEEEDEDKEEEEDATPCFVPAVTQALSAGTLSKSYVIV